MRSLSQNSRADAGFTLLEMLLVLTLLGLVATIAVPRLIRPSDSLKLSTTVREMASALRLTRSAAIARNSEEVLLVDVERRSFASSSLSERRFQPEIQARLKVAEPERISPTRGGFRFFPDGSSTGGEVELTLRQQRVKLCVHWLTGQPAQENGC
jgi:general secretion pathway protein H